jgi:4,5-DOPA dioxygenase extradiol
MEARAILPTLFLSHGSPLLALQDSPTGRFLDAVGTRLDGVRAVLLASAHDLAPGVRVGAHPSPPTVHDFHGFPPALDAITYPAAGDPLLAARIVRALRDAGLDARLDASHGLDHGAWVPLRRIFPAADRPVVTLSIDPRADAATHAALGRALSFLPGEGVLVVGSGGFTHNLGALHWDDARAPESAQSSAFADWLGERLQARDCAAVLDWAARAPHARDNHPTPEHLLPLFVAWGAAGPAPRAERWHVDVEYGALRMDAFAFHPAGRA